AGSSLMPGKFRLGIRNEAPVARADCKSILSAGAIPNRSNSRLAGSILDCPDAGFLLPEIAMSRPRGRFLVRSLVGFQIFLSNRRSLSERGLGAISSVGSAS